MRAAIAAMRLYLDLDSRNFLESPSFPRALATLELKRRDTDLLELQFLRDRTVQELPAGSAVRIGLKPATAYTAEFLASGTFTKSGTGTSTRYLLDLNLNTVPLNAAFAATATEPETLAAMAEIEWTSGTTISSSKTLPVTIANDVIRGDEGEPAELPLFYTSETSDFLATQAEAEAGTVNNKWLSPLRAVQTFNALRATLADVQAGVSNNTWVSPLRLFEAFAAWVASNPIAASWSAITGKPAAFPAQAHTHPLNDVTQSGATTGQVATWNGTQWAPQTPAAGSGGVSSWNDLTGKPAFGTGAGQFAEGNHTHSELPSPLLIKNSGEATTIHEWGIESEHGLTTLSFEEAFLRFGSNEVLNWSTPGELSVGNRRLVNLGAPVNANDAVRKVDLDNFAPPSGLTQEVTSITGASNRNLTANRWHIFTGNPSTANHTFTLPQNATNGDLAYITFLTPQTTGFQVLRFGYEGGSPQIVSSSFEAGRTYLFHYNNFDTARWRRVFFEGSGGSSGGSSWVDILNKPSTFPPSDHSHSASQITSGTLAIARIPTGATSQTVCLGNDSRLSNARQPTAHSHSMSDVSGLSDALAAKQNAGSYVTASGGVTAIAVVNLMPSNPNPNTLYIVTG